MSLYGVDVMQSWTDSRLAAVTHDVSDVRLSGNEIDVIWTPSLHVVNARRRGSAGEHRVLAVSTAGLVILHQRYVSTFCGTAFRCVVLHKMCSSRGICAAVKSSSY